MELLQHGIQVPQNFKRKSSLRALFCQNTGDIFIAVKDLYGDMDMVGEVGEKSEATLSLLRVLLFLLQNTIAAFATSW